MSASVERRPVFVRGTGTWTALGHGVAAQAQSLSGEPPPPRIRRDDGATGREFPFHDLAEGDAEAVPSVVDEALATAVLSDHQRRHCGVFFGSTCSDLAADEDAYRGRMHRSDAYPLDLADGHADIAHRIAEAAGLGGPHFYLGTACSSSGNALLHAARMIERGDLDTALVVGMERFNCLSLHGFDSLGLLARDRARPFDRDRDGLVLGEGAAALVLSRHESPWRVRGGATVVDTHSPTGSEAATIAQVIGQALATAGVSPREITAIKAHGTATVQNDRAEADALHAAFGTLPPITSLKGALGHTLGGCGAIETAAIIACVDHGFWPASAGFRTADTESGLAPVRERQPLTQGRFLLSFFGFGGNNCAYVIERRPG